MFMNRPITRRKTKNIDLGEKKSPAYAFQLFEVFGETSFVRSVTQIVQSIFKDFIINCLSK